MCDLRMLCLCGLIKAVQERSQGGRANPGRSPRRSAPTLHYCECISQEVGKVGRDLHRPPKCERSFSDSVSTVLTTSETDTPLTSTRPCSECFPYVNLSSPHNRFLFHYNDGKTETQATRLVKSGAPVLPVQAGSRCHALVR